MKLIVFRQPVLIAAICILLTLAFFWKLAFTDLILARGDTYLYFYPLWAARDAAFMQGQFPLWTPDIFMGAPLFSDPQVGVLYPPNWLSFILRLTPPDAVRLSILLHITWALGGAYLLGRRIVQLERVPALVAAVVFAFGGYVGAHVEQINQLQGVAWLPWALLVYHSALTRSPRCIALLAMVMALQIFSGHTQTVFITGVGLGVYGLVSSLYSAGIIAKSRQQSILAFGKTLARHIIWLILAALIAVVLALPQLYAGLELTGMSNRGGGFNAAQALAFSWNPLLIGRGLLPSYDAQVFSEYIAYPGIFGLMCALVGIFTTDKRRWVWVALVVVGIFLALGLYNPLNWTIATLPGFSLFRVPSRWLALFALGIAMLAGLGLQQIITNRQNAEDARETQGEAGKFSLLVARQWARYVLPPLVVIVLAVSTFLADRASAEVDGSALPTASTWAAWGAASLVWVVWVALRGRLLRRQPDRAERNSFFPSVLNPQASTLALVVIIVELWFASATMPYNDLADAAVYNDSRFSAYQLQAFPNDGRLLSITQAYFDPGDKATLEQRYADLRITERATRYALTAAKLKEVVAPNLSMIWGIPSVDGYGGGVLPTAYYTQFTSLFLPSSIPRTIDGRLREILALSDCRGACIPESRWLDLMNVRYLVVDKTFDLSHQGIRYDTSFALRPSFGQITLDINTDFAGDTLHILHTGDLANANVALRCQDDLCRVLHLTPLPTDTVENFQLTRLPLDAPSTPNEMQITQVRSDLTLQAVTLVDSRTGDFMALPLGEEGRMQLALSSDIKLYERPWVRPIRLIDPQNVTFVPDTWNSTEQALFIMRSLGFNPDERLILAGQPLTLPTNYMNLRPDEAEITLKRVSATHLEIITRTNAPAYLLLSDAYYPGWQATVNETPVPVYRANVMFRAVPITAGENVIVLRYAPVWLNTVFLLAGMGWLGVMLTVFIGMYRKFIHNSPKFTLKLLEM